jgi:hypothetical protein
MEFKQSTLEEIVESEHAMLLAAADRYETYYVHARTCSIFLSRCIVEVNADPMIFGRFFSLMKTHHMLALLSTLRLHKVQAMMNLRQVLEAGAAAAFALANPEQSHFAETDKDGLLDPSQELTRKRYKWLQSHYPRRSDWIKARKDQINMATAHANIVSSHGIFRVDDPGQNIQAPFFDIEDEYVVKSDLLLISSVALTLADFLYEANHDRNVIGFCTDFATHVGRLAQQSETLLTEIRATDRFKRGLERFGASIGASAPVVP